MPPSWSRSANTDEASFAAGLPHEEWSKVKVVRCGLDAMFLKAEPVPLPEARRLICVGRLAEQKGLPILIAAAGRLYAEGVDFELILVGDGPLRGEIERLIAEHDLGDNVRLSGLAKQCRCPRVDPRAAVPWSCRASPKACPW